MTVPLTNLHKHNPRSQAEEGRDVKLPHKDLFAPEERRAKGKSGRVGGSEVSVNKAKDACV